MGRTQGMNLLRVLAAVMALALGGCFQGATAPGAGAPAMVGETGAPDPLRSQIVFTALQMVGVPYVYGGATPRGFDCSGLVQYAYRAAGISVPRTSREQYGASAPVDMDTARAGDLVFFRSKDYSHVGIYLGDGRFVHAPNTGRTVSISRLDEPYYRRNLVRVGVMPGVVSVAAACGEGAWGGC
jgi:cell wall-associated NlpC family hydrolase